MVGFNMKELQRLQDAMRSTVVVVLAATFFMSVAVGQAPKANAPAQPSKTKESPQPPAQGIATAEVATQAAELSNVLRTLETQLAPSPAIEAIKKQISEVSEQINVKFKRQPISFSLSLRLRYSRTSSSSGKPCKSRRLPG